MGKQSLTVPNWRTDAVVWLNDPERGRVLAGSFGFVWWTAKSIACAPFSEYQPSPILAYNSYTGWTNVKVYKLGEVQPTALLRFVRSGLLP